jgi:anti-sigma B factor antagonist
LLRDNTKGVDKPGINIIVNNDVSLACLYGRIDIDSSPAVRERLLAVLQVPAPKILSIDFSAVTHIDSSGIATLIEALKIARGNKTELRLQGLHDRLLQLFEITGMLSLFNGSAPNMSQPGYKAV